MYGDRANRTEHSRVQTRGQLNSQSRRWHQGAIGNSQTSDLNQPPRGGRHHAQAHYSRSSTLDGSVRRGYVQGANGTEQSRLQVRTQHSSQGRPWQQAARANSQASYLNQHPRGGRP